jgi:POT family proton-dependent oligopeptide transporter
VAWRQARLWGGLALAALLVVGLGGYTGALPITAVAVADVGGALLLLSTVVFFGWLFFAGDWTRGERRRLYVVAVLFFASALFWSVFEQAGSTLNLFADRNTRTEVFGLAFPSSWFQSVNSFFIFTLAPVFAWLWLRLAARGLEPTSPGKFVWGLVLVGLGFVVLVGPARAAEAGTLASPLWLILTYLLHTMGELSLSPVGLSAMTRLAPARIAGLVMGVWFLGTSVGNFIGGRVAGLYESMALPTLFGAVGAFAIVSGLILAIFVKPMSRLTDAAPAGKA